MTSTDPLSFDPPEADEELLSVVDLGEGAFLAPSAQGRRGGAPRASLSFSRVLRTDDIPSILAPEGTGFGVPALKRLKHSHHLIARLIAEGRPMVEISAITGTTQAWLSTLKADPAFQELVAYYQQMKEAVYVDVHQRLASLGLDTIEELQARLNENPDDFTKKELMALMELTLDRSVAPPKGGAFGSGGGSGAPALSIQINFEGSRPEGAGGASADVIEGEIIP
jgi:hypothetical protein